jgi:hypothetical protein
VNERETVRLSKWVDPIALGAFIDGCEHYFDHCGRVVDQAYQRRLGDGMIRCYVVQDQVVGFGHQLIKALLPPPPEGPNSDAAQPGPRIMHGPEAREFQALRVKMESEWIPVSWPAALAVRAFDVQGSCAATASSPAARQFACGGCVSRPGAS